MTSKAFGLAQLGNAYSDGALGSRNRIINGAMTIDQRNAGAAVTVTNAYTLDRWFGRENTDGALSFQQVSDAPAGLVNSAKVTVTTADASIGADQFAYFAHRLEGFNISDFAFGTASASPVTLSFWIKSSLTGTFGGSLTNGSSLNRSYPFTYAVSVADTWEKKTITIAGDTTGTWATDNSQAMALFFGLGSGANVVGTAGAWAAAGYQSASGAVDLISTLNATWQITGVQLEAGDTATPFEHRSYGQELALCQRYYIQYDENDEFRASATATGSTSMEGLVSFPVQMRTTPTVTTSASIYNIVRGITNADRTISGTAGTTSKLISITCAAPSSTNGTDTGIIYTDTSQFVKCSAEL